MSRERLKLFLQLLDLASKLWSQSHSPFLCEAGRAPCTGAQLRILLKKHKGKTRLSSGQLDTLLDSFVEERSTVAWQEQPVDFWLASHRSRIQFSN